MFGLHGICLPVRYQCIAISGDTASGKGSIASALAHELPEWCKMSMAQQVRERCEKLGLQETYELPDDVHQKIDALQQRVLGNGHQMIIEGYLTAWLGRDLDRVYRVLCEPSIDCRVERIMRREKMPWGEAIQMIKERDRENKARFERLYGENDYHDSGRYHMRLESDLKRPDEWAREIVEDMEKRKASLFSWK